MKYLVLLSGLILGSLFLSNAKNKDCSNIIVANQYADYEKQWEKFKLAVKNKDKVSLRKMCSKSIDDQKFERMLEKFFTPHFSEKLANVSYAGLKVISKKNSIIKAYKYAYFDKSRNITLNQYLEFYTKETPNKLIITSCRFVDQSNIK